MIPPPAPPDDFSQGSHTVTFSAAWLPCIIGTLLQMVEDDYWIGTEYEKAVAADRAKELVDMFIGEQE